MISTAVLRRHLETMERLSIEYDFLPRESEILHLHFWDLAFQQMKDKGVLYLETEGKNAGCWVMRRPSAPTKKPEETDRRRYRRSSCVRTAPSATSARTLPITSGSSACSAATSDTASSIAIPMGMQCWISADDGETEHPHFGDVSTIYNVIDTRQAEAQNTVIEALRALGYADAADHYTHFSYEMVALTPRCASELGYPLSEDEMGKAFIEVSGRRGFGVKADDLIDRLIATAQERSRSRAIPSCGIGTHRDRYRYRRRRLRYFMLKFTKTSVIAFDFKEALSFEGETGPYAQYAVVRATNIFRKAGITPEAGARFRRRFRQVSRRRNRRPKSGSLAGRVEDLLHHRPVHRHHRARLCRQARIPVGAALQQLLPPPSHPQ